MMPLLIEGRRFDDKQIRQKARALLNTVGLSARESHRPCELSGGEAQRVAIARALINDPDIVFCDEPTGNLDSENADIIMELLMELNKQKAQTFLMVTHNEKISGLVNERLYIKDGALIQGGAYVS
jgi:ABC-type lipoprotein export system ATPase subunit